MKRRVIGAPKKLEEERVPIETVLADLPHARYVGVNQVGKRVVHQRSFAPHLMISGQTRSGKGGTIKILVCQDIVAGDKCMVIAPDPGEFGWLGAYCPVVDDRDAPDALYWLAQEAHRRRLYLREAHNPATGRPGLARVDLLPLDEQPPTISVTIDETPSLAGEPAKLVYSKKTSAMIVSFIASLAARGAKLGIFLRMATQYPTIGGTFGSNDQGGGVRNQLVGRIHCDRNAESCSAMFDSGARPSQKTIDFVSAGSAGRVFYSKLNDDDRDAVLACQVHWLEDAQALSLINRQGVTPWEPHVPRGVVDGAIQLTTQLRDVDGKALSPTAVQELILAALNPAPIDA